MNPLKHFVEDSLEKVEHGLQSQVKATAQSVKGQVTGNTGSSDAGSATHEAGQKDPQQQNSDQATKDMVKELYAPTTHNQTNGNGKTQPSTFVQEQMKDGKTPDEAMQMESLRKKLHDEEYYIPLTQQKSHEVEQKEEEQKKEQEKMEALQLQDEKTKKEQPIAVQMGANRAEQFPGASG